MKRLISGLGLAIFSLAACQTARTQNEPQVIVVPPDEASAAPAQSAVRVTAVPLEPTASPAASAEPSIPPASPVPPAPRAPAKHVYSSCNVKGPYIAMTFDDGPSSRLTPKLLDILKARGIKATFFVVGTNAAKYPDILKRIVAEGHEIGNHSWSHLALNKLSAEGVRRQMDKTSAAIEKATGIRPVVMRPPYGATNRRLDKRLDEEYGMKVILWSVDPLDWKDRNSATVHRRILKGARPGAIILSHDIHATTVAAMPETLDDLLAKGYKFVTVSELIAMDRPDEVKNQQSTPAATPAPSPTP